MSISRDVTIVIPQFNEIERTLRCCESIQAAHETPPRLVIVDDGSELGSLSDAIPDLSACGDLLLLPHRGVTAAWNAGLEAARTRWVVFLNNDTCSLAPWCEPLLAPLQAGAACLAGVAWRRERHLPAGLAAALPNRWLAGWCLAIERSRLLDAGGWDERFQLYFSDTDLQVRLRLANPALDPLVAVEGLPLRHDGHATTQQLPARHSLWQQDRREFHRKWRGVSAAPLSAEFSPVTASH